MCRHVLRNQHRLMRFLQQQIRLCSTGNIRPQQKVFDEREPVKLIEIPPYAYDTKSQPIEHEPDNGQLFKVNCSRRKHRNCRENSKFIFCNKPKKMAKNSKNFIAGIRFVCSSCGTITTSTETGCWFVNIWQAIHRSHDENLLAQESRWLAETRNYTNGKFSNSSSGQSTSLCSWGK